MVGTTLPAVVRIVDLPTGTTVTGAELFEVIQTSGGIGQSVQLPLNQLVTSIVGALPTGGATGQILNKTNTNNFSATWSNITQFVAVGTSLATTGSVTSIVAFVANQGITSTQIAAGAVGSTQLGALAVQRSNITSVAIGSAQIDAGAVLRSNLTAVAVGSAQLDVGAVLRTNLTAFLVGSAQIDTSAVLRANLTSFLIGSSQIDTSAVLRANLTSFLVGSSQIDTSAISRSNLTAFLIGSGQVDTSAILSANLTASLILVTPNIGTANGSALSLTNAISAGNIAVPFGNITVAWPNFGNPGTTGTSDPNVGMRFLFGNVAMDIGAFAAGNIWHQARLSSNLASNFAIVLSPNGGGVAIGTPALSANTVFGVQGTSLFTGTFILGSQGTGFLQSSSTGVITATPGSGNFVLLNTLSPNNVASTNDTSSFSATYKTYMITFENVCPATQTTFFQMQVATSGSAFITGSYLSQCVGIPVAAGVIGFSSTTVLLLSGTSATTSMQTSLSYGLSGFIKLFNPASTVSRKQIVGEVSYLASNGAPSTATLFFATPSGWYDGAVNPVTGVNFSFNSGNIQTGTIKIYGMT